jgi:hypothetical protein
MFSLPRVKDVSFFDEHDYVQVNRGNQVMKYASKIKLNEDDFVAVGMNYNYFMIPRLAYPKENLEKLKQQILNNQKMVEELRTIWNKGEQDMVTGEILQTMEKYFGKRAE